MYAKEREQLRQDNSDRSSQWGELVGWFICSPQCYRVSTNYWTVPSLGAKTDKESLLREFTFQWNERNNKQVNV